MSKTCDNYDPNSTSQLRLKVYRGANSTFYTATDILLNNPGSLADVIAMDRDSVLYIHGFIENYERDNVLAIINAYLDKGGVNFILLDWGSIALNPNYFYVANQVGLIGKTIAEFFDKTEKFFNLERLHIVGHSLGAHVAGNIGRNLKTINLTRITGLDPAGPLFYPSSCHITATDAKTVVAIHTDGRLYGTLSQTGSIDFFPNSDRPLQRGCSAIIGSFCSHQRSVKYYVEALKNPKAFPARRCNWNRDGKDDEEIYFGDSTTSNAHGAYCFNTNDQPPFGKGS
ncbi:unnamed protein product [Xylocopa violacea]|uniref:phospholipase A1 n=1 Tax=Xylocopa violacea TaxID=135666 RepID=A0ABP1NYR0_XYLVO